jgi:hypothetical protein
MNSKIVRRSAFFTFISKLFNYIFSVLYFSPFRPIRFTAKPCGMFWPTDSVHGVFRSHMGFRNLFSYFRKFSDFTPERFKTFLRVIRCEFSSFFIINPLSFYRVGPASDFNAVLDKKFVKKSCGVKSIFLHYISIGFLFYYIKSVEFVFRYNNFGFHISRHI